MIQKKYLLKKTKINIKQFYKKQKNFKYKKKANDM